MNQIQQINLGGFAFNIDIDAHDRLDHYIGRLEHKFNHTQGGDDILNDIETRMAELLSEHVKSGRVISMHQVEQCIAIMGSPEDISYDSADRGSSVDDSLFGIKTGKKLFRDPDQKVMGGVCSGLAQYFGIENPGWVRALFLLIFFLGGSGGLAYILLWAVLPVAKTSADRLAMQGKPIAIESIASNVREQFEDLEDKFYNLKNKHV